MSKSLWKIILVCCILAQIGCGEIGPNLDGFRPTVGMSRSDVFVNLGKPDAIFMGSTTWPVSTTDADAYHVYSTVGLSFRIIGDTVQEITLLNTQWTCSLGLSVGMHIDEAISLLGPPDSSVSGFYSYDDPEISLETDGSGRIDQINILSSIVRIQKL